MAAVESKSWLRVRAEKALVKGLTRAYSTVQVDPSRFLVQLRTAYRLPVSGYHGVYSLEMGELDAVADDLIRGGMKLAAAEGAGFGLGFAVCTEVTSWDPAAHAGEFGWDGAASTHYWISPSDKLIVVTLEQIMPYEWDTERGVKKIIYDSIQK